ncbi:MULTISPECIES: arginase [unclassified Mesorhizobium]|uniref:arginase n=2 Tax=Mesorhizobium TaxID=68287 RepID=UPI000FD620B7|nr:MULTISPECIES: arginase [unclassified Mesorhizobium]RUX07821.1 arginase [Mesorhizobium sp. M8A.F.Ca.ET.059.01.1.1]TIU52155.1 MAG: arginase [Mesorhizobium sp.]TGP87397.1 arginase [Mesorhizobium sp. M8A.F.Ca.ET.218.01.1.1]TGQ87179.1 arginase [Mesorhizobium sp. M8A.F.Ca.ET.208.01.1.1]TGT15416.1 arginase [Mesorhizobium sp. M8A.F.Ca.ET.213.01.1.1]
MRCRIVGAPVQDGAGRMGCEMGPSALRTAGLAEMLSGLGHAVEDMGAVQPIPVRRVVHGNLALKALPEISAWTSAIAAAAYAASEDAMPIFLGGDHSISAGTVSGLARRASEAGRPLFVLWLDAHPDFHTLDTTASGNLHGVPLAYASGQAGFSGYFPDLPAAVDPKRICTMGLRSVDPAERSALNQAGVIVHDMRAIDEHGIAPLLRAFLARVSDEDGLLHVSLDVDFLDPSIAPAVGTTVPGGATFREAHLVMEMLSDSGLVSSLDLVELNPFLDDRGRTATLMVDLTASLMGRRIMDRPTRSHSGSF